MDGVASTFLEISKEGNSVFFCNSGTGVRIGGTGSPTKMLDVMGHAYFACQPANNGFYFENTGTAPLIRPQFGHSLYVGTWNSELLAIYTEYLWVNHVYIPSDLSLKENIRPLENSLDKISKIQGYSFDFKAELYENSFPDHKDELLEDRKNQKGFIAQEIINEFPELVKFNSESETYDINYIGFIPELVEAIKEQQSQISELQSEIEKLKSDALNNLKSDLTTIENNLSEQIDKPKLFQNKPNPFSENTKIEYYLAKDCVKAWICIYNMNGEQLRQIDLVERGQSNITINGGDFGPGMYIYSMIADGMVIGTKQMVLTE